MRLIFMSSFLTITLCFFPACASKVGSESNASNAAKVYNLRDIDQQPQVRGMRAPPIYPDELKQQGLSGQVTLVFVVDTNGDVRDVQVVESTNRQFDQPAIDAVQKWKFFPGKKGGKPVNVRLQVPIAFNLGNYHPKRLTSGVD